MAYILVKVYYILISIAGLCLCIGLPIGLYIWVKNFIFNIKLSRAAGYGDDHQMQTQIRIAFRLTLVLQLITLVGLASFFSSVALFVGLLIFQPK